MSCISISMEPNGFFWAIAESLNNPILSALVSMWRPGISFDPLGWQMRWVARVLQGGEEGGVSVLDITKLNRQRKHSTREPDESSCLFAKKKSNQWRQDQQSEWWVIHSHTHTWVTWLNKEETGSYLAVWSTHKRGKVARVVDVHPPLLYCVLSHRIKGAPTYEGSLAGLHVLLSVWLAVVRLWWKSASAAERPGDVVHQRDVVLL